MHHNDAGPTLSHGEGESEREGVPKREGESERDANPLPPPAVCSIDLDCNGAAIADEPKIPCAIRIDDGRGAAQYRGSAGVEKRGGSSLRFPKPQYSVELRISSTDETERPANLLGMGRESDWILNGAYIDRSLLRNKLLFELFQGFGGTERYAPESAFCQLTLDGKWQGIYLHSERIKRDDDRVALPKDTEANGASFLLKQDDASGIREVGIGHGRWQLIYPHRVRATPRQVGGIVDWLDSWIAVVSGADKRTDLFSLIDLDSAVDFVLLQEFAKNNDAYFKSQHVWKAPGGRLHFTPWDLDLSFGQPYFNNSHSPVGWVAHRPALVRAMAQRASFQARLAARWRELRASVLSSASILSRIEFHVATIEEYTERNFERWPLGSIRFLKDDDLYPVTSHQQEIDLVRSWIGRRLSWMDDNIEDYRLHQHAALPKISAAGTGCEDHDCLWIDARNLGSAPCVEVRRVGAQQVLDTYCGTDLTVDLGRWPPRLTLRLRTRGGQHEALRSEGLQVSVVNREANIGSEVMHIRR